MRCSLKWIGSLAIQHEGMTPARNHQLRAGGRTRARRFLLGGILFMKSYRKLYKRVVISERMGYKVTHAAGRASRSGVTGDLTVKESSNNGEL